MTATDGTPAKLCRPCAVMTASAAERETGRPHRARASMPRPGSVSECTRCMVRIDGTFEAVEIPAVA